MERGSDSMQSLCRGGCGFYGSPATDGLCSVCYKEALKKKQQPPDNTPSGPFASHRPDCTEECDSSIVPIGSKDVDSQEPEFDNTLVEEKKKLRCYVCRKRLGHTGFHCRCGGLYCGVHRYSDKHDCKFDYRGMGAQEIRRNNPVVAGEKITKI